jgi:hypothetical protein
MISGFLLAPAAAYTEAADAAKVVQRRMVPNFKKSFERALRTARR